MLLLLLSACDILPAKEACADIVAPPVSACFGGETVEWEGYGTIDISTTGTVTSVATGSRPTECLADLGNAYTREALVVEIEDDAGARYVVSFDIPDLAAPVAVGDIVTLDVAYVAGEFGPDDGHVRLLDATDAPLVEITEAGSLDELDLPDGVTVSEGEERCVEDDGCGVYSKYDVDVAVSGEAGTLAYGEELSLGGYRIVSGGYEHQPEGSSGTCPDWFVAHATVAFLAE